MVWYGSNLVSRQKVSRYTNTTNTSCRYTYKDLDCRHTNTLIAVMVCTSVSYAFRIKNGELYPVTKYTKIISFLFLELFCVCNLYHFFYEILISYAHSACHHNFYIPKTSSLYVGIYTGGKFSQQ